MDTWSCLCSTHSAVITLVDYFQTPIQYGSNMVVIFFSFQRNPTLLTLTMAVKANPNSKELFSPGLGSIDLIHASLWRLPVPHGVIRRSKYPPYKLPRSNTMGLPVSTTPPRQCTVYIARQWYLHDIPNASSLHQDMSSDASNPRRSKRFLCIKYKFEFYLKYVADYFVWAVWSPETFFWPHSNLPFNAEDVSPTRRDRKYFSVDSGPIHKCGGTIDQSATRLWIDIQEILSSVGTSLLARGIRKSWLILWCVIGFMSDD